MLAESRSAGNSHAFKDHVTAGTSLRKDEYRWNLVSSSRMQFVKHNVQENVANVHARRPNRITHLQGPPSTAAGGDCR